MSRNGARWYDPSARRFERALQRIPSCGLAFLRCAS
jgi:hypothetical protein